MPGPPGTPTVVPVVSYYVHHQGRGHRSRFEAIRAVSADRLVAVSELEIAGGCRLAPDVAEAGVETGDDPTARGAFHWAPTGTHAAARLAAFAEHLHRLEPDGSVIDVSVEAALIHRLAGVPTILMRQHGHRVDDPHVLGYRTATRLLAPWPEALEDPDTPAWVLDLTTHVGFIVPPGRSNAAPVMPVEVGPGDVVLLWGTGGGRLDTTTVRAIAQVVHPGRVHCVGRDVIMGDADQAGEAVLVHGWLDDVGPLLVGRPVIVASAGNNVVARAARAGCPLVVVPQHRPFGEQFRHAQLLERSAVAAVAWCGGVDAEWGDLIVAACDRAPALAALGSEDGAGRAAGVISESFS